jgi:hypothetical protein
MLSVADLTSLMSTGEAEAQSQTPVIDAQAEGGLGCDSSIIDEQPRTPYKGGANTAATLYG